MVEASSEFRHADSVKFGSLSLVWDLIMKKGVGLPYINWSRAEAALLMTPRQGKTSQHRGMNFGVAG